MNNTGNSKDPVYENLAYGVKSVENKNESAYIEYDDKRRREDEDSRQSRLSESRRSLGEDSWLSLCLACLMCR